MMTTLLEGEIGNLTNVSSAAMASLFYCHFVSAKLPKGKWRLISLLPIFFIFTILPLYTTTAFFTAVTALFLTWLANFKLLLFAFDLGPIGTGPPKSLPLFIAIAALPFKTKSQNDAAPTPKKSKKLIPLNLVTEIPISALLMSVVDQYKDQFHPHILLGVYCCLIFLLIEISVEISRLVARVLLGLDLEPASNEPYLSTSLRDFWSRRWNLMVNGVLRETVHRPVRWAAAPVLGGEPADLVAVLATFLVSGLMHELLFWYITRASPSWEMTMFFVVHGVGVVVEFGLGVGKWGVPWWCRAVATVGFVVATSFWLFFPPLVRSGADVMLIEEFRYVGLVVKEKMVGIWLGLA